VTAPLLNEEPFCLDMATSLVSWNKIRNCRATNTPVPSDWGFDENGVSQADPHKLRSLRPSGDYKGFGLGMVVEVLCGVLSNGPLGPDIGPMFVELERKRSVSHFFGALDISSFCDVNCFKKRLQDCVEFIRGLQSTSQDPVMVAGDPEKRSYANRIQAGIPMEEAKFYELLKITKEFERARVS
jgi:ureidoglycolate dehydrogenase (NAD+)